MQIIQNKRPQSRRARKARARISQNNSFLALRPLRLCGVLFLIRISSFVILFLLSLSFSSLADAPPYSFREEHSRDGIGKFYMGREIAHVMGHQAADWLERPERTEEEKTDLLVRSLGIRPGQVVADIGAGTGYFSRRLAKLVGDKGQVLAVDIQPEMLDLLTNRMAELKINNVRPILGTIENPNLPTNAVDLVLMV